MYGPLAGDWCNADPVEPYRAPRRSLFPMSRYHLPVIHAAIYGRTYATLVRPASLLGLTLS